MDYKEQANNFCRKHNVKIDKKYKERGLHFLSDTTRRDIYKIKITRDNNSYTFTFGQSIADTGVIPSNYAILACLVKYDPEDYEYFLSEYGYDRNRESKTIYNRVKKEYDNIYRLFSDCLEELREIN